VIIFVNGSFGVGKTTVSRLLQARLPHSTVFDPEPIGLGLARLSRIWPRKSRTEDFQDLALWRFVSVRGIRLTRWCRQIVIVPMAFSNVLYLREFLSDVRRVDVPTFHFCLTAPHGVVRQRLIAREGRRGPTSWQLRRSAECCSAHQAPEFEEHIATEGRSPEDVADEIAIRVRRGLTAQTRSAR
jgi:thymidylate kinase